MNKHVIFPTPDDNGRGDGKEHRDADAAAHDAETEAFADAVSEALSEPIPHAASGDRAIFERSIAARRAEKLKQQQVIAAARTKCRQLTESIHAMEASLDLLLEVEA